MPGSYTHENAQERIQRLCLRKAAIQTRKAAQDAAAKLRRTYGVPFDFYRCKIDRTHFHVGNHRG